MNNNPKISVIILVYKAEQYFEACLESLFNQTFSDIEYIFVNDHTPDQSMEILEKVLDRYPAKREQVIIINNPKNLNTSTCRNIGLERASGDYMIYCDSDDWIDADMYEVLYNQATAEDADIVWCGYHSHYLDRDEYYPSEITPMTTGNALRQLLLGTLPGHSVSKLVKTSLYKQVRFPDGFNMLEDFVVCVYLFYLAKKITHVPNTFYHYRQNDSSVSYNSSYAEKRRIDCIHNINLIDAFLTKHRLRNHYLNELNALQLKWKYKLMNTVSDKKQFFIDLWPESNKAILDSPYLTFHTKLSMWAMAHHMDFIYRLRTYLLSKRQ